MPLRILAIGAHPDDCDLKVGGVAALYRQDGHDVRFVSVTNGESGHQSMSGIELAAIRQAEAQAAGRVIGLRYDVLPFRDGHLEPTLQARLKLIALIREYRPDLIFTHRPNDYHPDHRYTSQLVNDAAYMVTVPAVVPDVPALANNPVIAYMSDDFQRPYPFSPTVAVDIEPVMDLVLDMLACHVSQVFDFLPYNRGQADQVPADEAGKREFLRQWYLTYVEHLADRYRDLLVDIYGAEKGGQIRYIEAFETCEYGAPLTEEKRQFLFPFLPSP